eukprot:4806876-Prymnesium_polylepis.1
MSSSCSSSCFKLSKPQRPSPHTHDGLGRPARSMLNRSARPVKPPHVPRSSSHDLPARSDSIATGPA